MLVVVVLVVEVMVVIMELVLIAELVLVQRMQVLLAFDSLFADTLEGRRWACAGGYRHFAWRCIATPTGSRGKR